VNTQFVAFSVLFLMAIAAPAPAANCAKIMLSARGRSTHRRGLNTAQLTSVAPPTSEVRVGERHVSPSCEEGPAHGECAFAPEVRIVRGETGRCNHCRAGRLRRAIRDDKGAYTQQEGEGGQRQKGRRSARKIEMESFEDVHIGGQSNFWGARGGAEIGHEGEMCVKETASGPPLAIVPVTVLPWNCAKSARTK